MKIYIYIYINRTKNIKIKHRNFSANKQTLICPSDNPIAKYGPSPAHFTDDINVPRSDGSSKRV